MKDRFKKEIWEKDLKTHHTLVSDKVKTALKDTNSGLDFMEKWENRARALRVEGL